MLVAFMRGENMGAGKEKAKSWLGIIALGCALVVACVVAAPALAVVGVVVGTTTIISASTVVGATAVVATVGATAAVTKAALHVSDGEYQEAVESAVMAIPMIGAAHYYGGMYMSQTGSTGRMVTGASGSGSQSGSRSSSTTPTQSPGNGGNQGGSTSGAPPGYTQDANGRWHRPDGTFASNAEVGLPPVQNTASTSPRSLDWSIVSKKTGETRVQHVNQHMGNNLQKQNHGVFYGDAQHTINNAWNNSSGIRPITGNGIDTYHIPYENSGYSGGYAGQGQNLNNVTIITKQGTNQIITGYPSAGR